jgi:putative pyruvate formate lyase activating enzyme
MLEIITRLNDRGYYPVVLYNTNSFDNPAVLREIESVVDVYLPDIKYFSNEIARKYSDVFNYFEVAIESIKEMVWQKGTTLVLDDEGIVKSGVIVRHLILPGNTYDSKKIFNHIADEISTDITVSLMRQYYPIEQVLLNSKNLNRRITSAEYNEVVSALYKLGFYKGWLQDLDSKGHYLPDFTKKEPFS